MTAPNTPPTKDTPPTQQQQSTVQPFTQPDFNSPDLTWDQLKVAVGDLTPGQVKGRLEASRKWEERARNAPQISSEELEELRAAKARQDELEYDLSSTTEQRVADVRREMEQASHDAYRDGMSDTAETVIRLLVGDRIESATLDSILGPLDKRWFLTDAGQLDTDKVQNYITGILPPDTGTGTRRTGPSPTGQGFRRSQSTNTSGVSAGRDLWAEKHPSKAS